MEKIIEKFIPGTNKQYSITSEGIVYSHYRYSCKPKVNGEKKALSKKEGPKGKSAFVSYLSQDKRIYIAVNTLMQQIFKIKKPINKGRCVLVNKDGNIFNNALSNIKWKQLLIIKYKFTPKIYLKDGKIDSKRCGDCGIIKDIKDFTIERKGYKTMFLNSCIPCKEKRMYKYLKNDLKKYKKQLEYNKNYHIKLMSDYYIAKCLTLDIKELTPELIDLQKKSLTLQRQLKNNGKESQNA